MLKDLFIIRLTVGSQKKSGNNPSFHNVSPLLKTDLQGLPEE